MNILNNDTRILLLDHSQVQGYCTVVALTNAVFTCSAYCLAEGLRGLGAFENSANGAARGVGEQLQI